MSSLSASYLIVAGGGGAGGQETTAGGGGWSGGGGGAGGMLTGSGTTIDTNSTYLVTVGSGGAGGTSSASPTDGTSGSSSAFSMVTTTAVGGGGGGKGGGNVSGAAGLSGGSGGGGGSGFTGAGAAGGAGTSGQGSAGGTCPANSTGGGGGGKGGAGGVPTRGAGSASSISGASVTYATGGLGQFGTSNTAGTANTGNGGDNGTTLNSNSLAGGSGVVVISYAGSTQLMAGGTVTITGGNVIHTFTSSGYLTPLTLVGNSLRFRASNSAYLSRTIKTTSNRQTWTWSGWVKRGKLTTQQDMFAASYYNGSYTVYTQAVFDASDDIIDFIQFDVSTGTPDWRLRTTAVYRDPAAWYHIVFVYDSTNATSSDRARIYVNGTRVTSFTTASYPTQNLNSYLNYTVTTGYIGSLLYNGTQGNFFDGEMTEVNFVDGQALTPNSFGTFNSYGVWQPITYGGSYGTNGFYLPFGQGSSTYAASFNGSSQGLLTSTSSSLALGTNDFTVEYWVYFNATTVGQIPVAAGGGVVSFDPLFGYYDSGNIFVFYLSSNGSSWDISLTQTVGAVTSGKWYHVAITRSGSTFYAFLNGVQGSTFTSSASIYQSANSFAIGKAQTSNYTNGYISNVRVIIGTCLYTKNFVPSTTPLTAVTNTKLLTLQNATIIDNSTNALTFTNTGSVTTAVQYPFLANVTLDSSPAGNNWTSNNIGVLNNSSFDSMTDVPTLTSATVANYPTLNPLNASTTAAANNANLQAYSTSGANTGAAGINCTMAFPTTGLYYFEVTMSAVSNAGLAGIAKLGATQDTNFGAGAYANIYAYTNTSGVAYANNATAYTGSTLTTNDILGVAVDMTNGALYFAKNNTWQNSGVPTSGASRTGAISFTVTSDLLPTCYAWKNSGADALSINFGQRPFTYTAPSGYVNLNAWNL